MNTEKTKGEILADKIEAWLNSRSLIEDLEKILADYRKPEWTLGRSVNGFTLGEGQEWHKADSWTKEMLPDGYRPMIKGEIWRALDEFKKPEGEKWTAEMEVYNGTFLKVGYGGFKNYYFRSKRPLPAVETPWQLTREIKGFRPLADGEEWHRNDWTKDMLPDGWRPLLLNEQHVAGDEYKSSKDGKFRPQFNSPHTVHAHYKHRRTRRPLPVLTPAQIADGWLEWHGGECPVWDRSIPNVMFRDGDTHGKWNAGVMEWNHIGTGRDIIAYRPDPYEALKKAHAEGKVIQFNYGQAIADWCDMERMPTWVDPVKRYRVKPSPVMVPLGPEDVPPGSALRYIESTTHTRRYGFAWFLVREVPTAGDGVVVSDEWRPSFEFMKEKLEISRDGGKTWQRCEKEAK